MLTDVSKPPEPANKGPRQTDPHDTQTNAARRTAHRNASHVPQGECKASCTQQHLRLQCTSGLQMYCQQKRDAKLLYGSACVHRCLCVWVTVCIYIYTEHTFVSYIEPVHTCVYVCNQMGCSRSSIFVAGRRGDQSRNFAGSRYNQPFRAEFSLERRGGSTSIKE